MLPDGRLMEAFWALLKQVRLSCDVPIGWVYDVHYWLDIFSLRGVYWVATPLLAEEVLYCQSTG